MSSWISGRLDKLGLFWLALTHRLLFLFSNPDAEWPYTIFYFGDTRNFYDIVSAFMQGNRLEGGLPFHPPAFPWFLSGVYWVTGANPSTGAVNHLAVKIVFCLVGSCGPVLLYTWVKPHLGRLVAILSALMMVWHFGFLVLSVAPLSEGLFLDVLLVSLILFQSLPGHPFSRSSKPLKKPLLIIYGLSLGFLPLIRAEGLAFSMGQILIIGWAVKKQRWKWAWVTVCFLLPIAGWTWRNFRSLSQINEQYRSQLAEPLPTFVPFTLYGPINLALANHENANGTFNTLPLEVAGETTRLDLTNPVHLRLLLHGERDALAFMQNHPGQFVTLAWKKLVILSDVFSLGWTQWDLPGGLNGTRRPVDVFTPSSKVHAVFVLFPLAGIILIFRSKNRYFGIFILGIMGIMTGVTILFFGYVRLGLMALPFLFPPAALALSTLLKKKDRQRHIKTGMGIIALLMMLDLGGLIFKKDFQATGTTLKGSNLINQDLSVELKMKFVPLFPTDKKEP